MPVAPAVTDQLAAPWIGEPNTIRGGAEGSMGSKPASRPRTAAAAAAAMQLSRGGGGKEGKKQAGPML